MVITITTHVWEGEYDASEFPHLTSTRRDGSTVIVTETIELDDRSTIEIEN